MKLMQLSASGISTYLTCPKKYELSRQLQLKERPDYLHIGIAVHEALHIALTKGEETSVAAIVDSIAASPYMTEPKLAKISGILWGVYKSFPYYEYINQNSVKSELEFETAFTPRRQAFLSLSNRVSEVILRGRIDCYLRGQFGNIVGEFKTTSDIASMLTYDYLNTNFQALFYFHVAEKLGMKPDFVEFFFIKKPNIRLTKKETPEQYRDRIIADYKARPEFYFDRKQISKDKDFPFDNYVSRVIRDIQRDQIEGFRQNYTACTMKGRCVFIPICTNQPGWQAMYEERSWK